MKKLIVAAIAMMAMAQAQATLIDFDEFETGPFTGILGTEDGFTISATGGLPYIDDYGGVFGNPLNGFFNDASGTTVFSFVSGGTFTFDTLDLIGGMFDQDIADVIVVGYLDEVLQQSDTFSTTIDWTTYSANNLAGVTIDKLVVKMPAFGTSGDNLVLAAASGPEPGTLGLLGLGLVGLLARRRRLAA